MAIPDHLAWLLVATVALSAQTAPVPIANNAQTSAQTLIGQGWGVDHVGIGVRDLTQTQHDYKQLGFKVVGKVGHFPGGLSNCSVSFQNNSYLELLSVNGGTPSAHSDAADVAEFVTKHEGAMYLGIDVSSAKAAADYLKARNFDVQGPDPGSVMKEGETTPPPPMWYDVTTADKPAANKEGFTIPIFLVEYVSTTWTDKARAEGRMDHPNTAMGVHAAWFAVHDTQARLRVLRDAGFEIGESREMKFLRAHGREVKAGAGTLLLLGSDDKDGLLTKYLSDHDEGIIGLSIEVADLGKAHQLAESGTGRKLETYKGFYGTSFLLPPEVTHGLWLEMFQPTDLLH
jgi:catechol 2,3-dioxygenase-like lactoylglutathione lyase family enzyme